MRICCQVLSTSGNSSARITLVPGGILIAQGAAADVCTTGDKSDTGKLLVCEQEKEKIISCDILSRIQEMVTLLFLHLSAKLNPYARVQIKYCAAIKRKDSE